METLVGEIRNHSTEEQAQAVSPWEVNLRQSTPGPFLGHMRFTRVGDMLVYRDSWSQRTAATGALPAGYFALAAGAKAGNGIDWCGHKADGQLLALAAPDNQIDFIIPAQTPYIALLLPVRYLNTLLGGDEKQHDSLSQFHHYQSDPALGNRLIARLNRIIDHYQDKPGLLALDTGCVWGGSLTAIRLDGPAILVEVPSQQPKKF